ERLGERDPHHRTRAIDRIQYPQPVVAFGGAQFLTEDRVLRKHPPDPVPHRMLGPLLGPRHELLVPLLPTHHRRMAAGHHRPLAPTAPAPCSINSGPNPCAAAKLATSSPYPTLSSGTATVRSSRASSAVSIIGGQGRGARAGRFPIPLSIRVRFPAALRRARA